MDPSSTRRAAVIIAHPDDEVLWCGGLILSHPDWDWHIISVCRGTDLNRSPRFFKSMKCLNAKGKMSDLDDGPDQHALSKIWLKDTIVHLLEISDWDMLITHGPRGEYTRHRRHEEVCEAVVQLWETGKITCRELWMFAYSDHEGKELPMAIEGATNQTDLNQVIWEKKHHLLTDTYGFSPDSWETRADPRREAFFIFDNPIQARAYVNQNAPN